MTETRLPAQDDVLHLRVLRMAVKLVDPKNWAWNEVCSSFWRLYYNDVEGAEVEVEGKRYPIRAGRVYLIPPGVTFSCICHRPVDHLFFHFDIVEHAERARAGSVLARDRALERSGGRGVADPGEELVEDALARDDRRALPSQGRALSSAVRALP